MRALAKNCWIWITIIDTHSNIREYIIHIWGTSFHSNCERIIRKIKQNLCNPMLVFFISIKINHLSLSLSHSLCVCIIYYLFDALNRSVLCIGIYLNHSLALEFLNCSLFFRWSARNLHSTMIARRFFFGWSTDVTSFAWFSSFLTNAFSMRNATLLVHDNTHTHTILFLAQNDLLGNRNQTPYNQIAVFRSSNW